MQAADDIASEFARLRVRLGLLPATEHPTLDGRYRIEQTLGRGAMGVVHRVWDERLRRRVALKVVRPATDISAARLQARLEREALALAKVDHPNVVHIHDVGSHEGATYLTMQYVPGTTLRHWQEYEDRSFAARLDMYLQAARGLAAAHAGGLVHRDFKPDNVLVGDDGIVRVADFGIAAALVPEELHETLDTQAEASQRSTTSEGSESSTHDSRTATGMLMGTPPYMSPEQLAGARATARSDQFGFCVALWEALVGTRPFVGQTRTQLQRAILEPLHRAQGLPSWLWPILQRGLAHDPADRFADMNELILAIERARGRGRRLAMLGGLAAALVGALALGRVLEPETTIEQQSCADFVAAIDDVWGSGRVPELARLTAIDPAATEHAIATLDQLREQWRSSATMLCEHDLAPAPDARQRVCHEAWLIALGRSVDLLIERGNAETLKHAPYLLARLVPSQADFCALELDPSLDPELAELAVRAREAAEFGDLERAEQLAAEAIELASSRMVGPYSAELAEALEARGELLVLGGDIDAARASFAQAYAHALASGHRRALLDIALWRAHAAVWPGREAAPELALVYLEAADPIAHALELGVDDPRRGDLEIVRALVEQARSQPEQARVHLERAEAILTRAGQPIRFARALINRGTLDHERGELALARVSYRAAARVLGEAGVPERHRLRLALDYNLGLIACQTSELAGLEPLDRVARLHGDPQIRLRALNYGLALAFDVGTPEQARSWADRALEALAGQADAPADLAIEIEWIAALVLASQGDSSGEARLDAVEARAAVLDEETHVNLRCTRIDWLEQRGRCTEAASRLAELDAHVATLEPELQDRVYAAWRASKPAPECSD
jgi:tRNA A-37 threonylcarbamoyl transferase component Bud32/tetratricopeptide (TPR) repeat protein